MKKVIALVTILFFLIAFPTPLNAAPQISTPLLNSTTIPKYAKLEITFQITGTTAQNVFFPYDPSPPPGVTPSSGISVIAQFLPPGQSNWSEALTQPAFYYQDFTHEVRSNRDWMYPTTGSFKVRFAPPSTGSWQFRLQATDSSGTTTNAAQPFTVTDSTNKGFIRVSPHDPRYFQFEDGTYFPALGYNIRLNTANVQANQAHFDLMAQNGIQLGRTWLSSWAIFGSAWNPWNAMPQDYDGYLPRSGLEAYEGDFRLKLSYRQDNGSWWKATRFLGWLNPQVSLKPNTTYRIRVRHQTLNVQGPRIATSPDYGLVIKITNEWLSNAQDSGTGIVVSPYAQNTSEWSELVTTWNSGSNYFLPYFYLTLENVLAAPSGSPAATSYIDSVVMEEVLGNNQYGPNIINKPSMQHHTYADQRLSFAFDKIVDLAQESGIYLRLVILEKDEYIQNHIDFSGNLRTDDLPNLFYGDGRTLTAVRWYQQAYWRYLQARWGYSTTIHSWELLNEGNPALTNHYILADELGKYMRTFTPNHHLVSTSNWHSFNPATWNSYPNIDFGDVHDYIAQDTEPTEFEDLSNATLVRSAAVSSYQGPVIRGETGLISATNNTDGFTPLIPCTRDLHQGIWLTNFLWAGLNPHGLIESYWYNPEHIYPNRSFTCPDGTRQISYDDRPLYRYYYQFIFNIPLSNGHYQDLTAADVPSNLRVIGQKDVLNQRAHVWVQNRQATWKNLADQVPVTPVSATFTISGFAPNRSLPLIRYNPATGATESTTTITTNSQGVLSLSVSNLILSTAFKIGDYTTSTPSPTPTPDYSLDNDTDIDILDILILISRFGQNLAGDFNQNGRIDIFDFNLLLRQI